MKNRSPLVSIIMPAYNAANYIKESILSVQAQTYPHWELIVVNDGSIDQTEAILQTFTDSRIHYFFQENKGVSAARNFGLRQMKGKFFCFLDSDDIFTPQSIEIRIRKFLAEPQTGMIDGGVLFKDDRLEKTKRIYKPKYRGRVLKEIAFFNEGVFALPSAMIRREDGVPYSFNESLTHSEDLLFMLQVHARSTLAFSYVSDPILIYRKSNTSAMSNLQGLGKGYLNYYSEVNKMPNLLNVLDKKLLKIKIAKVMFLSYCAKGHYKQALKYIYEVFKK